MVNDIVPQILYDDRWPEYFSFIVDEMHNQGISKYVWHSPIMDDNVVKSINISQKAIVRKAKERGDKYCCIMEQDIWFKSENGWKYFIDNIPQEFDVYIGGSYLKDIDVKYEAPLTKVNSWIGNHCIIISERYYDKFLESNELEHIDAVQSGKGEFYLCYPMVAFQRVGFSANNKTICDYNIGCGITEEDIYKG